MSIITIVLGVICLGTGILMDRAVKDVSKTVQNFAVKNLRIASMSDEELVREYASVADGNGFISICGTDDMINCDEYKLLAELKRRGYCENSIYDVRNRAYEHGEQLVGSTSFLEESIKACLYFGKGQSMMDE